MGCSYSKLKASGPNTGPIRFNPSGQATQTQRTTLPHTRIKLENDEAREPPDYPHTSKSLIIESIKQANGLYHRERRGAFEPLRSRKWLFFIDTTHGMDSSTKLSIQYLAIIMHTIFKAKDAYAEFYFTNLPNMKSFKLSSDEKNRLGALMEIFRAQSSSQALELFQKKSDDLGSEEKSEFQQFKLSMLDKAKKETDCERLRKILDYIRTRMALLWHGWSVEDLTSEMVKSLFKEGQLEARKQPNLLNNVAFTYSRGVELYNRSLADDSIVGATTVFLITGSSLQPSETQIIQNLQQQRNERHYKSTVQKLSEKSREFCFQSVVFTDYMSPEGKKAYIALDNFKKDTCDIHDVTELKESTFLERFLSPYGFMKILNAHDPEIDNGAEFRKDNLYNTSIMNTDNGSISLPDYIEVRLQCFGMDMEDLERS